MADLSKYLKDKFAAQLNDELAGLKSAYEKNLASYTKQEKNLSPMYEDARNQAAAQNAIARRNFAEQAAASGLSSGASGQAALAQSSALQNSLAGINREQASKLQDIDLAKTSLQAAYENAMARATAANRASLETALYNEMIRQEQIAERERLRREQEKAAAAAAAAKAAAAKAKASSSNHVSGGGGGYRGWENMGYSNEEIAKVQKALGVTADGLWGNNSSNAAGGMNAEDAYNAWKRGDFNGGGGGGIGAQDFDNLSMRIRRIIQSGNIAMANDLWKDYIDRASSQQISKMKSMFSNATQLRQDFLDRVSKRKR